MTPAKEEIYLFRFQKKYFDLFQDAWKVGRTNRKYRTFWLKTIFNQYRMARRREKYQDEGIMVPPVLIYSITNRCNLKCQGCYAQNQRRIIKDELSSQRMENIINEASSLGVGVMMIAGGEPLMKEDVLKIAARHTKMIFPVFTNGVMLTGERLNYFLNHKNLIPVISLEGNRNRTDERRGQGLQQIIDERIMALKDNKQFFGLSITLTSHNFEEVMKQELMKEYHSKGCRLFFLVEYVPNSEKDLEMCLTGEQKEILQNRLNELRKSIPALFVSLPGDEEQYGGCLAAGRAFVHISSDGRLEPCPFAPYSDTDLKYTSLKEGLQSEFLSTIRNNHQQLTESKGGCALWENKPWVEKQLEKSIRASA